MGAYFIVGLGNPGRKYMGTRHNVGFDVVDRLANDHQIKITESKFAAFAGEGFISNRKVMLIKPTTFMNRSGECVRDFMNYYKADSDAVAERLIVIYDDVALPVGKLRIRARGSAGGHNGIKDILYQLEQEEFLRVRLGVGDKPPRMDLADYVLSGFAKTEIEDITFGVIDAARAVEEIITQGIDFAMNKYNPKKTAKAVKKEDAQEDSLETQASD